MLWWGKSYHLFHHFGSGLASTHNSEGADAHSHTEQGFGLTTPFWDFIFGTFPRNWPLYQRHPLLCTLLLLPFPLVTFVLWALFIPPPPKCTTTTTTTPPTTGTTLSSPQLEEAEVTLVAPFGALSVRNVFISCLGALSTFFLVY